MSVLVFGHKNPDTDAICAAIGYADYLQRTYRPDALAACCGPPNLRTEFVLKRCGLAAPKIIMDVRPEISDVCRRSTITAREDEVFFEVFERMEQHGLGTLPVLGKDGKFVGLLSLLDLLKLIFMGDSDPVRSRQVISNLGKVCQMIGGTFQHAVDPEKNVPMIVTVGAMSAGGFTSRLAKFPPEQLIVVSGDRPTIQLPALEMGVRALVVSGGFQLSSGLLQLARSNNVTVINSPHDTATTTMRIKSSRLINDAIERDCVTLPAQSLIDDVRRLVDRYEQRLFPVLDDDRELVGVISKSDLVNPPRPQIILVDHNELGQAVNGAEDADIVEVLDHHRLGGSLKSTQPIRFVNEPVGSTCTLVAKQFRGAGLEPTPAIALCLASGIISDTLNLRSPTATDVDREILGWLQKHTKFNLEDHAQEFFAIGSALRSRAAADVIREDCKEFREHGRRFSISQIEEIGFELFWTRHEELTQALSAHCQQRGLDFSALLVTDIMSNGSLLLLSEELEAWQKISYPRLEKQMYQLDGVVSRKKQLLPLIARLLEPPTSST
jgi:manganese-dependent inorganic pyrophosphatase